MRNREITSTYIKRSTLALLVSLGLLASVCAMIFLAPLAQAQQSDEDNSINDSFNTDITVQSQEQNCNVIIGQYNNAVAGNAAAAGDAVAATAAEVNAPVSVVNNCIQAGGDVVIGSGDNDGNDDSNDSGNDDGNDNGNDDGSDDGNDDGSDAGDDEGEDPSANAGDAASDSDNGAAQSGEAGQAIVPGSYDPNKVLAKTGGSTEGMVRVSPVSAGLISGGALLVLCGVGIAVWLGRIGFSGRG